MRKLKYLILIMLLYLCTACTPFEPVIPQDIESGAILFIAPQSGEYAIEGKPAADVFARVIDGTADLPYRLSAIIIDEAQGSEQVKASVQKYCREQTVLGICGFWSSDCAAEIISMPECKGKPILLWAALRESLLSTDTYPYVLRLAPTPRRETAFLCNYLIRHFGYTDWAIISDASAYGAANRESLLNTLAEMDCQAVFDASPGSAAAINREDEGLKRADLLFYAGEPQQLNAYLSANLPEHKIIAATGAASLPHQELPDGIYTVNYDYQKNAAFYEHFFSHQDFISDIGFMTPLAHDAAGIFIQAVRNCGTAPTGTLLAESMASAAYDGIYGRVSFDSLGESTCTDMLCVKQYKDSKWSD